MLANQLHDRLATFDSARRNEAVGSRAHEEVQEGG